MTSLPSTNIGQAIKAAASKLALAATAGEVLEARDMASLAYDAAKRAARLQKAKRAHDDIIAATHRAQADALEIEALAKRKLADEYDAAQERGEVVGRKGGGDSTVPYRNAATAAEAGLSRKEVFEARQMRDVIEQDPGIVRRALDQMLAAGSEPTRAELKRATNLRAAVGTDSATAAERGNNLYETPPEAMRTLLSFKRFTPKVWEPACGKGAISRMLEDAGYEVELSDLVDYGTADRHGEVQRAENFLASASRARDPERPDIVTNPPYGTDLNAFVAHALRAHRPRRMALLLNLNFLCGFDDPDRCFAMDEMPPARVYVFSRRLPMMHRVVYDELSRETREWDGPAASSRMNTAWFVWELREVMGVETYDGPTEIMRVDWKVFEHSKPCGPLDVVPVAAVAPTRRAKKAVPA